jgi:N-acetylmuramoyl-L-alanine amidase
MKIGISAGHGGTNPGCVVGGFVEKLYTPKIAWSVYRILMSYEIPAFMIRNGDETVSLGARAKRAADAMCSHIIDIHVNASASDTASGAIAFYEKGDHAGQTLAERIAQLYPPQIKCSARLADDKYPRVRNVLSPHAPLPRVLVECGFATNRQDLENLNRPEIQERIAQAIAGAVVDLWPPAGLCV